ncbi:putative ABC transport system permease protein [Isoptericola jiangsuensis]|uniref:Putative ABC transport system permease protein n=1 Tax=Isoptericola jiangsuensis TaxID=548579 RepID=A0A2A9F0M6_9MICO|nr:ABC transporter permease [Isoptericola jiangsuensis]PFG44102.1 putative ABC transport system permease protein [Isoptericola jiangsuensis]
MLRITLAQMRSSAGRLAAAGVAILIGTAFVTATLLASGVITRTTYDAVTARYADADLVVSATSDAPLTPAQVADVDALGDVEATAVMDYVGVALVGGSRTVYQSVVGVVDDRLQPLEVTSGALPAADDEVALPTDVAERLGVAVGDGVGVETWSSETGEPATTTFTVSGLVADPSGAFMTTGGAAVVSPATFDTWLADQWGGEPQVTELAVALADGADVAAARGEVADAVGGTGREVVTTDERAEAVTADFTGGQDLMFLVFTLTFAAIALLVAGLVIANTFQVLVAQRTRTLALLRCVGADKRQVSRGVLTEAAILGVVASVAGVVLGALLGQGALWVAHAMDVPVPLPATITLTWQAVVLPVAVGTLVTVLSALVPARAATRVAPLAALRPADAPSAVRGAGKVRLVLSVLATVAGFALLAGGAALGLADQPGPGLLAGVAGGTLSFVGVAVGAVFWLPKVTAAAVRLVGVSGPTARLAGANTLRNPRRTAATSTALLIGVTLVATMSTGAASARESLTSALDDQYPVDVTVSSAEYDEEGNPAALPDTLVGQVAGTDGVARAVPVTSFSPQITWPGSEDEPYWPQAVGVDPGAGRDVLRTDGLAELAPGTVLLPSWTVPTGADTPATVTVTVGDESLELRAVVAPVEAWGAVLSAADTAALTGGTPTTDLWVGVADVASADDVVPTLQDVVADSGVVADVSGAAVERASFEQVIDTLLAIVVGLLAVAVVIALIGVANTLSLSVIERRRESATLRAIGLSKAQLRGMLAIEGLLIAGVGAVLGIALGLVYGWAGSAAALGIMGDVSLAVPWLDVTLVLLVAVVAGLVASVVPARTALKASPVEALAAE